jgi:predicted nucleotidyltransferase
LPYNCSMTEKKIKTVDRILLSETLSEICRSFDVSSLSLFGSYSRDEATSSSDIDLLVEFNAPKTLVSLITLQNLLSEELDLEVDLLTSDSLSPYLRDQILDEAEPIYVKG